MQELLNKTIDKVSFKINIPILISIIVWVAIVTWWYFNLMSDMKAIQTGIVHIIARLDNDADLHKVIDMRLAEIEKKVIVLETKVK